MLVEVDVLREMRARIEKLHAKDWRIAYVEARERGEASGISEYEVYGLFHSSRKRNLKLYWYNRELPREEMTDFATLTERFSEYKSVSFHWWSRWS
jgi:hypothetical protein